MTKQTKKLNIDKELNKVTVTYDGFCLQTLEQSDDEEGGNAKKQIKSIICRILDEVRPEIPVVNFGTYKVDINNIDQDLDPLVNELQKVTLDDYTGYDKALNDFDNRRKELGL